MKYDKSQRAKVYRGRSLTDNQEVVVKAYDQTRWFARAQEAHEIFQSVRTQLLALGIPDFIAAEDGMRITEYIPGRTMKEIWREKQGLDITEVKNFLAGALPYLDGFRSAGVQHGDIKPDNFLENMVRCMHQTIKMQEDLVRIITCHQKLQTVEERNLQPIFFHLVSLGSLC